MTKCNCTQIQIISLFWDWQKSTNIRRRLRYYEKDSEVIRRKLACYFKHKLAPKTTNLAHQVACISPRCEGHPPPSFGWVPKAHLVCARKSTRAGPRCATITLHCISSLPPSLSSSLTLYFSLSLILALVLSLSFSRTLSLALTLVLSDAQTLSLTHIHALSPLLICARAHPLSLARTQVHESRLTHERVVPLNCRSCVPHNVITDSRNLI